MEDKASAVAEESMASAAEEDKASAAEVGRTASASEEDKASAAGEDKASAVEEENKAPAAVGKPEVMDRLERMDIEAPLAQDMGRRQDAE